MKKNINLPVVGKTNRSEFVIVLKMAIGILVLTLLSFIVPHIALLLGSV